MKCGTTALAHILNQHKDISVHIEKEPNWFTKRNWNDNLNKYHSGFSPAKKWIDASTHYSKVPESDEEVAERIHQYNPNSKIIYIIRQPIDRIVSDYLHLYQRGYTKMDFSSALFSDLGIVERSKYFMQISYFTRFFNRENILILTHEEFVDNPEVVIARICDWIGIQTMERFNNIKTNVTKGTKFLAKYDFIRLNTPKWIRSIISRRCKDWLLQKMRGPSISNKPAPSATEYVKLKDILYDDIKKMHKTYGTPLYFDE